MKIQLRLALGGRINKNMQPLQIMRNRIDMKMQLRPALGEDQQENEASTRLGRQDR